MKMNRFSVFSSFFVLLFLSASNLSAETEVRTYSLPADLTQNEARVLLYLAAEEGDPTRVPDPETPAELRLEMKAAVPQNVHEVMERFEKLLAEGNPKPTQEEMELRTILDTPIDAEYAKKPLAELLQEWEKRFAVPFSVDLESLEEEGMELAEITVTLKTRGISLRSVLDIALAPYGLTWETNGGELRILTQIAALKYEWRVYPFPKSTLVCGFILPKDWSFSGKFEDMAPLSAYPQEILEWTPDLAKDAFIGPLTRFVAADSWVENGGGGRCIWAGERFLVQQTPKVHAKIERFMAQWNGNFREPDSRQRILTALETPISLELKEGDDWESTTLGAIAAFEEKLGIPIFPAEDVSEVELHVDLPWSCREMPAIQALGTVFGLDQIEIREDCATLGVGTMCEEPLFWPLDHRVDEEKLITALEEEIHPDFWINNGGYVGSVGFDAATGRLLIQNSLPILHEVRKFLQENTLGDIPERFRRETPRLRSIHEQKALPESAYP